MPDKYWEEIGKKVKDAGREDPGKSAGAMVKCKRCGNEFFTNKQKKLCGECRPEKSSNPDGPRTVGLRLQEAMELEDPNLYEDGEYNEDY